MKQRLLNAVYVSIEWRIIAFVITNVFLWIATGEFLQATVLALELHLVLLVTHFAWYFTRQEKWHPAQEA